MDGPPDEAAASDLGCDAHARARPTGKSGMSSTPVAMSCMGPRRTGTSLRHARVASRTNMSASHWVLHPGTRVPRVMIDARSGASRRPYGLLWADAHSPHVRLAICGRVHPTGIRLGHGMAGALTGGHGLNYTHALSLGAQSAPAEI